MLAGILRTIRNRGLTGTAKLAYNMWLWNALRLLRRKYATVPIHEFRMMVELFDPGLSRQLFVYRDRELALGRILRRLVHEGARVLDIGGNLGYYPIMEAMLVGPSGHVVVMEPLPSNFQVLQRNVCLNGCADRVESFQLAAHETQGTARFYVSSATNLGTLFPESSDEAERRSLTGTEIDVETVDLDTFIEPLGPISLIRMDPEGAEVSILRGLISSIREGRFQGRIVTEIHPSRYDPDTNDLRPVLREVFSLGYYPEIVTSVNESDSLLHRFGYQPAECVRESNRVLRGIYRDVAEEHLTAAVVRTGAVRDLVLAKRGP